MHPSGTCIQVCFGAKEIQDRRTVLSERAVLIRVHRINAATSERSAGTKTNCPNGGVKQETQNEAKKTARLEGNSRCTPRRLRACRTATIHPPLLTIFATVSPAILYSDRFSGLQMTMPSAAEFEKAGHKKPVEFRIYPVSKGRSGL
jgi:hypothetical protein